ncbi:uncharacterized protein FOMMEDRAFT_167719 [Fomitiporia mediterranea MF3/22]|uniref:uncharacterized protein n=1 Tax=Fomitiporia mediterranea (strain MF3/22) TaxID=694068 RepID=UPI000440875C|nr:uncharacterized protein FOMMEDRAFT_167719 [Fomitiporia mediterranea MF3/22]EJD04556.1 hypothetical protein FOMMEDRAFT_167719 [Fomitiporia mediterranea MF3/22]
MAKRQYAPPPHPPPKPPLLKHSTALPYPIDLEQLASQGWTNLPIQNAPSDPLYSGFSELFEASAKFFNLPEAERLKYRTRPTGDAQISEEGYSRVEGEKCMIALRKSSTTPTEFELREKAARAWAVSAGVMKDVIRAIEEALDVKNGALVRAIEKQLELPGEGEQNVATLMRMFRYDRPLPPSSEPPVSSDLNTENSTTDTKTSLLSDTKSHSGSRVVAEPHKDLGLLTIVIGHSPGLECWDTRQNGWVSCETREGLNATILAGQMLAKFTNMRFVAGRHRVFVHPASSQVAAALEHAPEDKAISNSSYRFSLVHALRGHLPLLVSSNDFETAITGAFPVPLQFLNVPILEIYKAICNAHWNVNISVEERRKQEQRLKELAERARTGSADKLEFNPARTEDKPNRGSHRLSRIFSVFQRSSQQPTSVS